MYEQYVSVNEKFKPSVNLLYDLNNEDKILHFVPTTDLCDVIKTYINQVIDGEGIKSTLLAGPYGKGKSYLILMILYLLSKRENKELLQTMISRFSKVDSELADKIQYIEDNKISLLPVIINNNESDDINQNFMLALNNALANAGIKDIVPNSSFQECIQILDQWENDRGFDILKVCTEADNINLKQLRRGLEEYQKEAYDDFCDLYSCVTHGLSFHPIRGNDFGAMYENVSRQIQSYGYKGLFVVFDEFGVFLETQTNSFKTRLNKIQAFAEKANSSTLDAQLHLCCIAHKDLKLYKKDKFSDEFDAISGRFSSVSFDRSLEDNYQILCGAIKKKDKYDLLVEDNLTKYRNFYSALKKSGLFLNENQIDFIIHNAYPINPVTLYALIQISEKIAQNERTLFTYISDNDQKGFRYFIANNDKGMINVDSVFDYFKESIKENVDYKSIFYKAESLMRSTVRAEEQAIIKTIAIIKLIDDDVKCVCMPSTIALCLAKEETEIEATISELIQSHKLKRDINDGTIDFSIVADEEINDLIDRTVRNKSFGNQFCGLLTEFDKNKYSISHQYNFENKMTRFYKSIYVESSVLKEYSSKDILFKDHECDGLLINVYNDDESTIEDIKRICDIDNILLRFNVNGMDDEIKEMLYRVVAIQSLLKKSKDYNEATIEALTLLLEDTSSELQNYINNYNQNASVIGKGGCVYTSLNDAVYSSLKNTYNKTIVLNNEQVNKHDISSVITKARNKVINNMLELSDYKFSPTSAESTVKNSFDAALEHENAKEVIDVIKYTIINANDSGIKLSEITDVLINKPYGIRKGVIPLYLAYVMKMLTIQGDDFQENVMIYNGEMELALNAENLTKAMLNPSKFIVSYKKISKKRLDVMNELLGILQLESQNSYIKDVNAFITKLRVFVTNLAPTIIKSSKKDNVLGLTENALDFKDLMLKRDLNAYDMVNKKLPEKLHVNQDELPNEIEQIIQEYEIKLDSYYQFLINKVKSMLVLTDESIHTSYSLWKNSHNYIDDIIFDNEYKLIYQTFESMKHNDKDAINALSHIMIKSTLDDYNGRKDGLFVDKLNGFIQFVEKYDASGLSKESLMENIDSKFSDLGKTLFSNLEDVVDEYGDSISNKEKVNILKKLINDILN